MSDDPVFDDLTHAPIPDVERIGRCSLGWGEDGSVELSGPPTAVLSVARWLRRPSDGVVDVGTRLAGEGATPAGAPLVGLALVVAPAGAPSAAVVDGRLVLTGDPTGLGVLADAFETVGVGALDVRFAPVERRARLGPPRPGHLDGELVEGSVAVVVASAYPSEG